MNKPLAVGKLVRTEFLRGTIASVIDGRMRGWRPTWYYVCTPASCYDTQQRPHTVRHEEVLNRFRNSVS